MRIAQCYAHNGIPSVSPGEDAIVLVKIAETDGMDADFISVVTQAQVRDCLGSPVLCQMQIKCPASRPVNSLFFMFPP
jgi:hypothetical protein